MNTPGKRNSRSLKNGLKQRENRIFKLLGGKAFLTCAILIFVLFLASGFQEIALRSSNIAAVVSAILVELANGDRSATGLQELAMNPTLVAVAQAKANDMAEKSYFAHTSPEGIEPWHWFETVGYSYAHAGENLAINFSDSADVEHAWMNSPAHRDNILNSKYTEIGIATAQGAYEGRTTTFVVQVFGTPSFTRSAGIVVETPEISESVVAEAPGESDVLGVTEIQSSEVTVEDIPAWGYLFGYPKAALRYAYYALALLILLALAAETGFEFRAHHIKRAYRAGFLLASMAILFVVADYVFFAAPVLALG